MLEFTGAIPSTDNLFKFLFIGGLLLVFTAMIYPMQKRQALDIELVTYNKEVELLNNDIDDIQIEVKKLKELDAKTMISLKKLQKLRDNASSSTMKNKYATEFATLKSSYLTAYDGTESKLSTLKIKNIILSFNKEKVKLLKDHSDEYSNYTCWFLIAGIPFILIGIMGWSYSTYKTVFKSSGNNPTT